MVTTSSQARRRGRPPKGEAGDTKAELLAAALRLFARHGYAGTSIRAIAREVGLSESVLYAHFGSKRAIFEAVLAMLGPQSAAAVLRDTDPALLDADPPGFVRTLAARIMQSWDTPEARQLISLMSHDGLTHDPLLAGAIGAALGQLAVIFEHWISSGPHRPRPGRARRPRLRPDRPAGPGQAAVAARRRQRPRTGGPPGTGPRGMPSSSPALSSGPAGPPSSAGSAAAWLPSPGEGWGVPYRPTTAQSARGDDGRPQGRGGVSAAASALAGVLVRQPRSAAISGARRARCRAGGEGDGGGRRSRAA